MPRLRALLLLLVTSVSLASGVGAGSMAPTVVFADEPCPECG